MLRPARAWLQRRHRSRSMMLPTWLKITTLARRNPWERRCRRSGGVVVEIGDDLFDVQPGAADAIAAEADEVGSALDTGSQHVDVDVGAFQLAEDGLELSKRRGVPGCHWFGHVDVSSTRLRAVPVANVVVIVSPGATSPASRTI